MLEKEPFGVFYVLCWAILWTGCMLLDFEGNLNRAPHNEPEEVVRAYVEAIIADDCKTAEALVSPERRDPGHHRIFQECANESAPFLISANIKDMLIEKWDGVTTVTLFGDFYTDLGPRSRHPAYNDQIMFSAEEVDGIWYVKP
jgi:hypothetical protein